MGRHELLDAVKAHGGYVTPGMAAHHLDFCADGTAEAMVKYGVPSRIYSHKELWERLETAVAEDESGDAQLLAAILEQGNKIAISAKPKGFSNTYRKWKDVLSRDTLTNSEVTYLGHRLSSVLGSSYGHKVTLTRDEALDLLIHVTYQAKRGGYELTPEQIEKGRAWLSRRDVQRELERKSWDSERLAKIARTVTDFRFMGYDEVTRRGPRYGASEYKPIYRAISPVGSFDYRASPWVDGNDERLVIL